MHLATSHRLAMLGAIGVLAAACSGDPGTEDAADVAAEAEDPADETDDSGESDDAQDAAEATADATVAWDGEPIAVESTRCDFRAITNTPNGYSIEAHWDAGWLRAVWDQDEEKMASVLMQWNEDDEELGFHAPYWNPDVDIDGEVDFEVEERASGWVHLMPNKRDAEARLPDGARVEFDIACPAG